MSDTRLNHPHSPEQTNTIISHKLQRQIDSINNRIKILLISEGDFLEKLDRIGYRPTFSEINVTHGKIGTLIASISYLLEQSCSITAEEFAHFFTIIKHNFTEVERKCRGRQIFSQNHPQGIGMAPNADYLKYVTRILHAMDRIHTSENSPLGSVHFIHKEYQKTIEKKSSTTENISHTLLGPTIAGKIDLDQKQPEKKMLSVITEPTDNKTERNWDNSDEFSYVGKTADRQDNFVTKISTPHDQLDAKIRRKEPIMGLLVDAYGQTGSSKEILKFLITKNNDACIYMTVEVQKQELSEADKGPLSTKKRTKNRMMPIIVAGSSPKIHKEKLGCTYKGRIDTRGMYLRGTR